MKITNELVASFKPCTDRHLNYLKYYKNKEFDIDSFLDLEHISYNDKIWIVQRILNKNQLVHWAILCAQSVLPIFEKRYPNNKDPRKLLEYLISLKDYSDLTQIQKDEIWRLKCAAYVDAAYDAAYAAVYAAAYAAANAADAAYAAANAAYAAANAAAYASYAAADGKLQQNLNLEMLKTASKI